MTTAKAITFVRHQDLGVPEPDMFAVVDAPLPTEADLSDGDFILTAGVFSVDPYQRGALKSTNPNCPKPGDVLGGFIAGTVTASRNPTWPVGTRMGGSLPYKTVQVVTAAMLGKSLVWPLPATTDISLGVGILGMPGSTAYGGLIDILRPNKGETIWVSGAAGAVGSLVGQLAKNLYGCKVIGSAGGADKCALVEKKFGFDKCIDYKGLNTAAELEAKVREFSPDGIDMYYDNVGGIHFDAAYKLLKTRGRIALCGGISMYGVSEAERARSFDPLQMIYTFQRIEGFVCAPWLTGKQGKFHSEMPAWVKEGKVAFEETEFKGVERFGEAFHSLFVGGNTGKAVVRI